MSDLFREVDEALKQEKMELFWQKYKNYIIIFCVSLVLGTAISVFWKQHKESQYKEKTAEFYNIIIKEADSKETGKEQTQETITQLKSFIESAPGGLEIMATLNEAALEHKNGNVDKAISTYESIIKDHSSDQSIVNLANIYIGYITITDEQRHQAFSHIEKLTETKTPWKFLAKEVLSLRLIQEKKLDDASKQIDELINDPETPDTIKQRSYEMKTKLH